MIEQEEEAWVFSVAAAGVTVACLSLHIHTESAEEAKRGVDDILGLVSDVIEAATALSCETGGGQTVTDLHSVTHSAH